MMKIPSQVMLQALQGAQILMMRRLRLDILASKFHAIYHHLGRFERSNISFLTLQEEDDDDETILHENAFIHDFTGK